MNIDKTGIITLGDLEATCKSLGLGLIYPNIKNYLKEMVDKDEGGIDVADLKKNLKKSINN